MKDFTFGFYIEYLKAIKNIFFKTIRFDEYFLSNPRPDSFCIIRHDVDRKPFHALEMAKIENEIGLKATYFFRIKNNTFIPDIIEQIASLGHEIGYHYENLSDMNGDKDSALRDFENNILLFKNRYPVRTISMHGAPLKPFNNLDLWKDPDNRRFMFNRHDILGDVTLDIDYWDIAYINDTGRNWMKDKSNLRDKVDSNIAADFGSGEELLKYLSHSPHHKIVFQVHPERWSDNKIDYYIQLVFDLAVNSIKTVIKKS